MSHEVLQPEVCAPGVRGSRTLAHHGPPKRRHHCAVRHLIERRLADDVWQHKKHDRRETELTTLFSSSC
jgi:hypothetical protein